MTLENKLGITDQVEFARMKGIDASYHCEGYAVCKVRDLQADADDER
ncbi:MULTISPECIES: hypothetical protein [unclassified Adlercreutzia]|nr:MULTISPECIES: hypothetical protein [unclassified Adlercreutzia]